MKTIALLHLLCSLEAFVAGTPISSQSLPRSHASTESLSEALQAREDVGSCSIPNPVEIISNIYGALPENWQAAFRAGTFFGGGLGSSAWGFCKVAAGNKNEDVSCTGWGVGVGGVVFTAGAGVVLYLKSRQGVQSQSLSAVVRRDMLVGQMEAMLRARGVEFDSILGAPLVTRRDDTDVVEGQSLEILGVRSGVDGVVVDHKLTFRDDGTGGAMLTVPSPLARRGLAPRNLGPGIKVAYNFVKVVDPPREVDEADIQALSQDIGADWEKRANKDHGFGRYFGQAQFGLDYTMQFEIIPESGYFNDNYENVNVCKAF